jgi:hypothetical protein
MLTEKLLQPLKKRGQILRMSEKRVALSQPALSFLYGKQLF